MSGAESIEEEVEEVTRCICGNIDLKIEDDYEDTGLFVQCDSCLVWQHGYCVGLLNDSQMPETYYCERCRPDLHRLIQRARKSLRSKFLGVEHASSPTLESRPLDEAIEEAEGGARKRRSTMNSRDAAYDRQLEAALLLSAQQNGGTVEMPAPSVSGRSGRGTRRQSPSLSKRGRTQSPSPTREEIKQKRRKKVSAPKKEDSMQDDLPGTKRKSKKKTTAILPAASHMEETPEDLALVDTALQSSKHKSMPHEKQNVVTPAEARAGSRGVSREGTPIPTGSRKRGTRVTKKIAPASVTRGVTSMAATVPFSPSGRLAAMSEMRKRVSAILEYVGSAQEEMATEATQWSQFLDSDTQAELNVKQQREDSVWSYGHSIGGSVELMEELIGKLLKWENLYSR